MANEFRTVNLAFNLAGRAINPGGDQSDCNSGGSSVCWSPTRGCGSGGMTCFGTSSKFESLEAQVSLPAAELDNFQKEINALISKFASKKGPG